MKLHALSFLAMALLLSACEKSTVDPTPYDGHWRIAHKFGAVNTFRTMSFADGERGWVAGAAGKIMYSGDGGANWSPQNSTTTNDLYDIYFLDRHTGWAGGAAATLLKTGDGGATWTAVHVDDRGGAIIEDIEFINPQHGWLLTNSGKVFCSTDGGESWDLQLAWPEGGGGILTFIDHRIGYVKPGIIDCLFHTSDGGQSWTTAFIGTRMAWERDMFFIDSLRGWVCNDRSASSVSDDYAAVFGTVDGGAHWQLMHRFDERYFTKICFLDAQHGWLAGRKLYFSTDSGHTWTCQLNSTNTHFVDLQFVAPALGYALDFGGKLYKFQRE